MKQLKRMIFPGALALALALAVPALAEQASGDGNPNPYLKPDGTWISISGTVKSVSPNAFLLDYGKGLVTVEMDDGDRDADGYKLIEGDKVTVNGRIDDDFYETTKIEASSVFVEKIGTYFYASAADEEDYFFHTLTVPVIVPYTVVRGIVTAVGTDEFTVDTGLRALRVEVDKMPYNPLDDEGYQKIRIGDVVKVTGNMDSDFFEGRELEAQSVIKLSS